LTKISYIPKLQINPLSLPQAIESVKRQMITQSLEESEGNITQAAAKLGITRRGLQKLLGRIEGANTDQMENE
jgi:DNA-binding NtrC family response regulator